MTEEQLEHGAFIARFLNNAVVIESKIVSSVSLGKLTLNDGKVIYALSFLTLKGKNQIKYVSDYLILTPAACSTAVKKLEKYGYVKAVREKNDKRNVKLVLSDKAYQFIVAVNAYHSRLCNEYKSLLGDDLNIAINLMRRIDQIVTGEDSYKPE